MERLGEICGRLGGFRARPPPKKIKNPQISEATLILDLDRLFLSLEVLDILPVPVAMISWLLSHLAFYLFVYVCIYFFGGVCGLKNFEALEEDER